MLKLDWSSCTESQPTIMELQPSVDIFHLKSINGDLNKIILQTALSTSASSHICE